LAIASVLLVSVGVIVVAIRPSPVVVEFNQGQYQWLASNEYGAWNSYKYQNQLTSTEFTKTGNSLHASWDYNLLVEDQKEESSVYVFDKDSEYWVQKSSEKNYDGEAFSCDYSVKNFFRGYLDFSGQEPSTESFNHGVAYQWMYIYAPEEDTGVKSCLPFAQWDAEMGAWLVGFNLFLWDHGEQDYSKPGFPDLLNEVKPVPGKEYSQLDF
jgi:hypothetical protein